MIYKFKSKASGDVIMMADSAEPILRLIGKEPAAQGIFEVADMPAAISAIEQAVATTEATPSHGGADAADDARKASSGDMVSLHQRAWPLVEMLKRSHAENAVIVWGV